MILKFTDTKSKVMLEYLRTIPNVVEDTEDGLVRIDFGKSSTAKEKLLLHLKTIFPYSLKDDPNQVYEVVGFPNTHYDSNAENIIIVLAKGVSEDKLAAYLRELTDLSAELPTENSGLLKIKVNLAKTDIVKTLIDFAVSVGNNILVEYTVPVDKVNDGGGLLTQ